MNQPLFGNNQQSPYIQQLLAEQLRSQNKPIVSPVQGLAEVGSKLANTFTAAKLAEGEKEAQRRRSQALAEALTGKVEGPMPAGQFGPGAPQEPNQQQIMARLLGNPDTSDLGAQMAIAGLNNQQSIEQEIAKRKALQPFELELAREKGKIEQQFGASPAAVKIADEIQKARAAGDTQRVNDLLLSAKMLDKGIVLNQQGQAEGMSGYNEALGGQTFAEQTGKNQSDLAYKPEIANLTAQETEVGKQTGEARAKLKSMEAQYPRLVEVTDKLSDLGKDATYTYAGRAEDVIQRELGMNPGKDAVARTEYMATVDNEVLPLLRQTFGAQFTVQEGESLRRTLGDPNKSPEEKDAVLRAFIDQKSSEIESLRRQTDQTAQTAPEKQTISLEEFLNEGD